VLHEVRPDERTLERVELDGRETPADVIECRAFSRAS